jgi:hypothetical protein
MAHGLFHEPDFDFDIFRSYVGAWNVAGAKRLIIEWQTGPGPTVAWYPAGDREVGKSWKFDASPSQYNEQYADYLDHTLTPRLEEIARAAGLSVRTLCVDQQPIQVMRMRRRELERAQQASGVAVASH